MVSLGQLSRRATFGVARVLYCQTLERILGPAPVEVMEVVQKSAGIWGFRESPGG